MRGQELSLKLMCRGNQPQHKQAGLSKAQYWMNNAGEIHFEKLVSRQDDHTEEVKKFAELIVRECAKVADDGFASSNFGNGITGHQLLKHFGVEE